MAQRAFVHIHSIMCKSRDRFENRGGRFKNQGGRFPNRGGRFANRGVDLQIEGVDFQIEGVDLGHGTRTGAPIGPIF